MFNITYKGKGVLWWMWQDIKYALLIMPCGLLFKYILYSEGKSEKYQNTFMLIVVVFIYLILKALPKEEKK